MARPAGGPGGAAPRPDQVLAGARVLLGVTGGIAAYTAAELARELLRAGAEVQPLLTEAGERMISRATFAALTGRPVPASVWDDPAAVTHVDLARWGQVRVVAPAPAHTELVKTTPADGTQITAAPDAVSLTFSGKVLKLGATVKVVRNDAVTLDDVEAMNPDHLVISPGPCTPTEAGICVPLIRRFAGKIPLLGVCLGHQAIGQAFGARVIRAQRVMHGKLSSIVHDQRGVFADVPSPFNATRYHSLAIERSSLPPVLDVTATAEDGEIMALRHRELPVEGVQFHPEAILTEHGHKVLQNFLATIV